MKCTGGDLYTLRCIHLIRLLYYLDEKYQARLSYLRRMESPAADRVEASYRQLRARMAEILFG